MNRLPGHVLVSRGLADLAGDEITPAALVIRAFSTRLRSVGIDVPPHEDAELALYSALRKQEPESAFVRYHAMLDEVLSFLAASERRRSATGAASSNR